MSDQGSIGRTPPARGTRAVAIEVDANGRGMVKVDGKDVSPVITGLTFELRGGAAPEVVLYGGGPGGISYEGPAYITLGDQPAAEPDAPEELRGSLLAAWLISQAQDDSLEAAMMAGVLTSSPFESLMAELIRRAGD